MGAGQGPDAAGELDHTLASLAEAFGCSASCSLPYIPPAARAAGVLGARALARRCRVRRARRRARSAASSRCSPSAVIDSHTHLDVCEPPDAQLVAAAGRPGVTPDRDRRHRRRVLPRRARRRRGLPEVYAAIGRHPNSATGFDDADFAELEALAATRMRRDRRDRPGLLPRPRARARISGAPSRPRSSSPGDRQAAGDPHPRRRRRHAGPSWTSAPGLRVILHCFSMADRSRNAWPTRTGGSRSPATPPTRRRRPARGRAARPRRAPAGRDRRALPLAPAGPRPAQPARQRGPHRPALAVERRVAYEGARALRSSAPPRRCSDGERPPAAAPASARGASSARTSSSTATPRRDRAAGRAYRRRRRARGRRRARRAVRAPGAARAAPARRRGRRGGSRAAARAARAVRQRDAAHRRRARARPGRARRRRPTRWSPTSPTGSRRP